jgi:hypothetical protein
MGRTTQVLTITSPWHNAEKSPTIEGLLQTMTPRIEFLQLVNFAHKELR